MEVQHEVAHSKELVRKLRELIVRMFKEGVSDLKPLHKLVLGIRVGMRQVQRKTEELKESCARTRDEADVLQLEVENANYMRRAYQESIERAEREPTPHLDQLHIDPSQDSNTVRRSLETEREVTNIQARSELIKQLEVEHAELRQVKATRQLLFARLQRFQQLAESVQTATEALKTFANSEMDIDD